MHPCKSFTDDLGGETYLDRGGKILLKIWGVDCSKQRLIFTNFRSLLVIYSVALL